MGRLSLVLIAAVTLNFLRLNPPQRSLASDFDPEPRKDVIICHRSFKNQGRSFTLIVPVKSAKLHSLHGDTEGDCEPND